jgi:hypothetical protein
MQSTASFSPSPTPPTRLHTSAYASRHQHTSTYVRIRQHRARYKSRKSREALSRRIRQHKSGYVSIQQDTSQGYRGRSSGVRQHTSAYVGIRRHTSVYVSVRQHTSAYVSIRQHGSACVSIRQHTSACVCKRPHTQAYVVIRQHPSADVSEVFQPGTKNRKANIEEKRKFLSRTVLEIEESGNRQHTSVYAS